LEQGEWALRVDEKRGRTATVLKILREELSLSVQETAKLKNLIPGIILSGTGTEMERVRLILMRQGITSVILPLQKESNKEFPNF
ncbi:MAG TPA: hypothetical protein VKQ72_10400, partial [Aggregatilineales bacterium]|nr:hypothetical protein [Aggregatilineales bacterium]